MFARGERISENTSAPSAIPITKAITDLLLITDYKTTKAIIAIIAEQEADSRAKGRSFLGDFMPLETSAQGSYRTELVRWQL
jgi:hypothetical protein